MGIFNRIRRKFRKGSQKSAEAVLNALRQGGARIGSDVVIYDPATTVIDATLPWLVSIGDHVRIAAGVKLLTHDYAWSVLKHHREIPGSVLGAQGPVTIGSHVYIGMDAIITRGVTVGDRVIIGAGSVVTRDCEPDSVYAGNPAKKIATLDEYMARRQQKQFSEARALVLQYRDRFKKDPEPELLSEYFMLFCTRREAENIPVFRKKMELLGNYSQSLAYMDANPPKFDSYRAFLAACKQEGEP